MTTPTVAVQPTDEIVAAKESADKRFLEAVEDRFRTAIVDAKLDDGDGNIDKELVDQRVYDVLRTKHVAKIGPKKDDRYDPATSTTKDELTATVFSGGPTIAEAEQNEVVKKVYEKCRSVVWDMTAPSRRGLVQRRLEADKLLLVRGKVFRNGNPIATGIYVSTHEEIVVREFMGPRLEKLRKLTEAIEDDYKMATERAPALDAPLRTAIESAMREATAKLPVPALGAGESNGKVLEK